MTHTRLIRTTARQDMIRIRDELKAELDTIYGSLPPENREPVLVFNKQLHNIENEIYHLRRKARKFSLAPEEDERFSERARARCKRAGGAHYSEVVRRGGVNN